MEYMESIAWGDRSRPKFLRIDQMEPDLEIIDNVLKPKVRK